MGLRFKLIFPVIAGYILLATLTHFIWLPQLLSSEKKHYQENQQLLIASLKPEIIRSLISADLARLYSLLDEQMALHKYNWQVLQIKQINGDLIYPMEKQTYPIDEDSFEINTRLQDKGNLYLLLNWKHQKQEILNTLNQLEIYLLLIFGFIILASLIWQNQQIKKPIHKLKTAINKLASGDFDVELPATDGNDEISQLNRAFTEMQADLQLAMENARESEAQQRAVINTIADAVILIDDEGTIEDFNPAAERIFGYDLVEVLGKNIKILMPAEYANHHDSYLKRYIDTQISHILGTAVEVKGQHSNGLIFPIELTISEVIMNDNHRLFVGVIRNITERKKTEAELQLAAASFDTHEGILITNKDTQIIKVNSAFTKITGYSSEEVLGRNPNILASNRHDKDFYKNIWQEIEHHDHWSGEIWNKRKNGEVYPEWLAITAIRDNDNNIIYYIGNFLDVSEQKTQQLRLEEKTIELEHARDHAEAAGNAKTEFLATMSHEIRTPMNGVLGMAQLLSDTPLNKTQQEYLDVIQNSGQMLLNIINDILDFSKIDADKMQLELISFDLEQAIFDSIQLLSAKAEEKCLEIIYNYSDQCPKQLLGDAGRIRQIMINLLGNAIKFTQQGHILVDIHCEASKDNHAQLLIKVIDTGIGISPQGQRSLFESFAQADSSTTRKFGGTGLGLAISKKLIGLMGGEIGINSTEGKGSEFWFRIKLPVIDKPEPLPRASLDGVRILIVDDNPVNRKILIRQLENVSVDVIAAESASQAMDLLHHAVETKQDIHLAILDFMMPDINGKTLGQMIHNEPAPELRDLPLILLTSCAQRGEGTEFQQAGFSAYLSKPVRVEILLQALETSLALKQQNKPHKLITRYSFDEVRQDKQKILFTGHILLAEDDITNQKVACGILQQFGLTVDIAHNGRQAIDMFQKNQYSLILMDCRMPEVDGYEATKTIRSIEQSNSQHIPIIALTANIQSSDQNKCLQAGMDDFLGKPFRIAELRSTLGRWLQQTDDTGDKKLHTSEPLDEKSPPVDITLLNHLRSSMGELFAELIPGYIQDTDRKLQQLQTQPDNLQEIELLAHSLKSSSATIGALTLSRLAEQLEQLARKQAAVDVIQPVIDNIKEEYPRVRDWLNHYT